CDQRVEHSPLRHPEARHHRQAERGEDARLIATSSAPRNLAPEMPFSFAGDLHALLARFLAKAVDASRAGACARFRSGVLGQLDIGKDADDQDLITIGSDL